MRPYREQIVLIPNPLDLTKYPFFERKLAQPSLIWIRSFHKIYNPILCIRVVAHLARDYPELRLTMVGPDRDGSMQAVLEAAEKLGVSNRLSLPGVAAKSAIPLWLQKGDIFLNSTNIDNMPVSVLEAMACGLCVISTNVGGIPYLLENGSDALTVPADDALSMANAVREIVDDSAFANQLSCNARRKVEQFDWQILLPKWESILIQAAESR
jgi:glycosyltransferase involved in cell wall biosynthesis